MIMIRKFIRAIVPVPMGVCVHGAAHGSVFVFEKEEPAGDNQNDKANIPAMSSRSKTQGRFGIITLWAK
jgi:predicted membrane protein